LNEEPDVGKLLVRFCEGLRHNWCMAEILWHRRETRRQTENTNIMPIALEGLSLLDKNSNALFLKDIPHNLRTILPVVCSHSDLRYSTRKGTSSSGKRP